MGSWLHGTLDFFQQYGVIGLFVLSFVEASFFPVPPYLLSIPMTLARPRLGLFYAGVGIAGSALGGLSWRTFLSQKPWRHGKLDSPVTAGG